MANDEGQKQKRTPFSARLPQASLNEVTPVVEALAALGVPSTPHVIAQQMGLSYSTNSGVRTRVGAAGYYGFIRREGERRVLTARGEALVGGDEDAARNARREAVMSTTFGPIIYTQRGRPVSENTISIRLQSEHNVPEGSAPGVAKALENAAREAELITDNRFDAAAIENLAALMPGPGETPQTSGAAKRTTSERKQRAPRTDDAKEKTSTVGKHTEVEERPFVPGVQVVVNIDASKLTPREIAEIVRELQKTTSE